MEELLNLLKLFVILLHWRILVAAVVSFFSAGFLANTFFWFSGPQGIVFFLLGCGAGGIWHAIAWEPRRRVVEAATLREHTKLTTAALACVFSGYVWGSMSNQSAGSVIFGALAMLASLATLYVWRSRVHRKIISTRYATVCLVCTVAFFALPIVQRHLLSNGPCWIKPCPANSFPL